MRCPWALNQLSCNKDELEHAPNYVTRLWWQFSLALLSIHFNSNKVDIIWSWQNLWWPFRSNLERSNKLYLRFFNTPSLYDSFDCLNWSISSNDRQNNPKAAGQIRYFKLIDLCKYFKMRPKLTLLFLYCSTRRDETKETNYCFRSER